MIKYFISIFFLMAFFSCVRQQEPIARNRSIPKVEEAKGYVVPQDSLTKPKVILSGKPRTIKAGNPGVLPIGTNIHLAGVPKSIKAGTPMICIPGNGNFSLPRTVPALKNFVIAGIPEVVIVQEAHISENSQYNFSSFGKLQGLKTNTVSCITQDNLGNIWLGSTAGITRYDGYSFAHYTHTEGLSNNSVLSILYDKNNNLWIGTAGDGVTKYDGRIFTTFSGKEGLLNDTVFAILEDKNGNIWFGTSRGATKYDGSFFTHYSIKEGLIDDVVFSMCEDRDGNLWFGTAGGVSKFDGRTFSNFTDKQGLRNNVVRSILQDKSGIIWFGTDEGVSQYDGSSFTYLNGKEGLINEQVNSIIEDRSGNIWFSRLGDGVYKYDGKFITHYTKWEGLENNDILCVFQGKRGILWFGTMTGGVIRFNGHTFDHFIFKEGLKRNRIQSILSDKNGNLWLGTWGGGVYKYDGKSFTHLTEKEGLINNDVRSIIQDKNGNLWFGTWGGVSKFDGISFTQFTEKNGLSKNVVISILEDASGNLWFGTEGGGASKYDGKHFINYTKKEGLSGNIIRSIIQDRSGNIWFATDEGVTKYKPSGKTGTESVFFTHYTEKEGLLNNIVISILEDYHGNIWFGTAGGGITKFDGKYFTCFTEKDGLCNNGVTSVLEDKRRNLWIGTRTGISKMAQDSHTGIDDNNDKSRKHSPGISKSYTYEDGFFGVGCNNNSMCEDRKGAIWIGANDRLTVYQPDAPYPDTIPPNIQLTGIELFFESVPWTLLEKNKDSSIALSNGIILDNIKFDRLSAWYNIPENLSLPFSDNFITFNFIGITTKSTQNVKYQYTLKGLDQEWSFITTRTSASYSHLPDGEYTFRVKAMNSEGYWSKEFIYNFTIRPPWWKTKLAYLIYTLTFLLGIILVDRIQTQRVITKERERTRDRELEQARILDKAYQELHLQNQIVEKQKNELELEKKRSDTLLRNILPFEVAEELKKKGHADVKLFEDATVLFADFKGFTYFSERSSPQELVEEIHICFSAFDLIMEKYGVEKIKTIGDAYMAAGGIPTPNQTHAIDVVKAGLEIQQFMHERKLSKEAAGEHYLEVRIGIHTGPLVAGVVGMKKFAYDIWGDTVNTAYQMEIKGESGKINISGTTYRLVKDRFNCTHRGKIEAKNKGMIDMYFVDGSL